MDVAVPAVTLLHERDNVAVARRPLAEGERLAPGGLAVRMPVPRGHKVALAAIPAGQPVRKYGQVIGFATAPIEPGDHVHTANMAMSDLALTHEFCVDAVAPALLPEAERATFQGYLRPDGRVGTRNYIAVIASVNCSATVCQAVAEHFNRPGCTGRVRHRGRRHRAHPWRRLRAPTCRPRATST